ncbi:MAG TPA: hypothetical protein VK603_01645 [Candidatus Saccharimonadales bacterium]|nr:hypothetical protein [Candidatus Saccharimonadales bacterium]
MFDLFGETSVRPMGSITTRRLAFDRPAESPLWAEIRTLCCRTGDNGGPIAKERWEFFAKLWVEPYERFLPEWTYVALFEESVVGYLTGCPDSRKFARMKAWRMTLPLLLQIVLGRYRHTPGAHGFGRRAFGLSQIAERGFSRELRRSVEVDYPAHLHVNVDEGYRRMGIGRRLIENYLGDLRSSEVVGVHLFCGADPVEFYRLLGFEILGSAQFRGASIFSLGRKL